MTKFIVNDSTDALKTDINLFFTITNCRKPLYRKDMIVIIWPAITGGLLSDALPPTTNVAVSVMIEQFSYVNYSILRSWFCSEMHTQAELWTVQHLCTCWRSLHKSPWFLRSFVYLRRTQVHFDTINFDVWNNKTKGRKKLRKLEKKWKRIAKLASKKFN